MLIKLDTDTMAFTSLLVSVVGAVAAVFAAFYANIAAFYAKKAATKDDQTRVEQNTRYVERFSNKILTIDTPMHPHDEQEATQAHDEQEAAQAHDKREATQAHDKQEATQAHDKQEATQGQEKQEATQAYGKEEAAQAHEKRISISVEGEAMGEVPLELFLTLQDPSIRVSRVETLSESGKTLGSSPCKATDNALVFKSILAPKKVRQWWDAGESTSDGEGRSVLRVYLLVDESRREVSRDVPVSIVEGLRNVGITTLVAWTIKGSI
jgi:hypothetical protein